MTDILWADDQGAMGLSVTDVLPRHPFSRTLMQARSGCCSALLLGLCSRACYARCRSKPI